MKRIAFFLFFIFILVGCTQQEIKESQVYVVQDDNYTEEQLSDILNVEGRIPFQEYVNQSFVEIQDLGLVLLTISPNGKEIYLMERIETDNFPQVIMGETGEQVRIIREDRITKEQEIIVENIPFVSKVLWNTEESKVAFNGGGRLTIYDVDNRRTIMEEQLTRDTITSFFWSPIDENKLYSEESDLANGSIYYLASQRKVEAYETREETYYKGKLDSNYYYGTKWDLVSGDIKTVILDKQGKTIKVLTTGRFRDAYQKSLVAVGERGFGLYYIRDINNAEKVITLTKEYIYDVKFIADGKVAYTTMAEGVEDNLFYLHIISNDGSELKKVKVHGGSIAVLPDGNSGYISGSEWQKVDFIQNKLEQDSLVENEEDEETGELQAIYTIIRGAMTTLYDFELMGEQNWSQIKKHFKNTHLSQQWAYFDVEKIFQEKVNRSSKGGYAMKIDLKTYDINATGDGASVTIGIKAKNPYGRDVTMDYALELIKSEDKWYVAGFSTFPYSTERQEIEDILQEMVTKIQMGQLFSGELEDSEIVIGQIQFWLNGIPHLAPSVETANAVKVFLQVEHQGKEEIYKLVLEKVSENDWKPTKLTQEDLSTL